MLRVCLLGELAAEVDGEKVELPTGRPRELFAWLALNRGSHRRSDVAARFWPDILDTNARASLRTALWAIRRSLGPAAEEALISGRDRIGLKAGPPTWTDLATFDDLLARGELDRALPLCRDDLLLDLDQDWVLEARDSHRERAGEALRKLASQAEAEGDLASALSLTRRRVELDPLDEAAHRDLFDRLAAAGSRVQAARAYRRLRERLATELGLAPSPSTRETARSLGLEITAPLPPAATDPGSEPATPERESAPDDPSWIAASEDSGALPVAEPPLLRAALDGPFVGRETELRSLREALADAKRAELPRLALLLGEAGVGKTRLLGEFARGLDQGEICLYGRAEDPAIAPYWPFAEALSHRLGRPARSIARLGQVLSLVEDLARSAPVVLCLDDVHRLDRSGVVALRRLLSLGPKAPLLVVAAFREQEVASSDPLFEAFSPVEEAAAPVRIQLSGLRPGDVDLLLRDREPRGELSATIHDKSAGNPLFVKEMLRDLEAQSAEGGKRLGVPDGIRPLVERRIGSVSGECVRALRIAAVIGQRFDLGLLERVSGRTGERLCETLDEAARAGLVVEDLDGFERFSFSHDLLRDALLTGLTKTRRARIHARIAEALEQTAVGRTDLAALAFHWCEAGRAGDRDRAVELAMRAAELASGRREYGEAVALYNRGLAVVGEDDDRRRTMLIRRGVSYLRLEHFLWVRRHGVKVPDS